MLEHAQKAKKKHGNTICDIVGDKKLASILHQLLLKHHRFRAIGKYRVPGVHSFSTATLDQLKLEEAAKGT